MTIGLYKSNSKKVTLATHDIIVIVINSLRAKDPIFVKKFGFIIYDEAHEYHTTINKKVFWFMGSVKYVLGLSATPFDRPDGLDRYVTLHLGEPIYAKDITSIQFTKFMGNVNCIQYYGDDEFIKTVTLENGMISTILTINNIIYDPSRIELIITEIKRLHNADHGIFVFAEHRDFLTVLKNQLLLSFPTTIVIVENEPQYQDIDYDEISILKGGISRETLLQTKKRGKHIVLTTYGYSRRGISLTEMTALVLTTPRRNGLRQVIGRILRKGSDENIVREVVDIIDMRSILKNQFKDRKLVYEEKLFNLIYKNKHSTIDLSESGNTDHISDKAIDINSIISSIYDSD